MNSENTPEVTLVGSADKLGFDIVQCQFPMGNRNAILALVKGQTVKIQGKLFSDVFVPGAPLGDCKLIEAGSSPAIVVSALQLAKDYRENPQAASTKYNEKPLILEGTVVDIKPDEGKNCYTFTMAGPDAKAANPIRLNVDCRTLGQHHVRQLLETVKKGQTIKIKGEGLVSFSEFFKECKVIDAMLLD
jgi:hypothetical protein